MPSDDKVYVVMPTRDNDPSHECFWAALMAANDEPRCADEVQLFPNKYSVVENRNWISESFMRTDCTHLMTIDDDVCVQPDAITCLLDLNTDIAVGCYPFGQSQGRNGLRVCVSVDCGDGWLAKWPTENLEVERSGAGCMLIHRRVFEKLGKPPFSWPLHPMRSPKCTDTRGEDCRFCDNARAVGFTILCHAGVKCGHYGRFDLANMIDTYWTGPRSIDGQKHPPEWGSHMPALKSIADAYDIRTVVEFGAGEFSTKTFLDRSVFPNLERLLSYEHDDEWIERLKSEISDERWSIQYCHVESMPDAAPMAPQADLVFIDCGRPNKHGTDYMIRGKLLTWFEGSESIVVMHDTETSPLTEFATSANYAHKQNYIAPLGPNTGIFSNHHDLTALPEGQRKEVAHAK